MTQPQKWGAMWYIVEGFLLYLLYHRPPIQTVAGTSIVIVPVSDTARHEFVSEWCYMYLLLLQTLQPRQ